MYMCIVYVYEGIGGPRAHIVITSVYTHRHRNMFAYSKKIPEMGKG